MLRLPALSQKAWVDTRTRFLIGLTVLLIAVVLVLYGYNELITLSARMAREGKLPDPWVGSDFREFVWTNGVRSLLRQNTALFAVMLAAGGLRSQATRGGGGLFMLSLPVTRAQVLWNRAGVGLTELALLTLLPMLFLSAIAPAVGQHYSALDALVHGASLFVGGSVLFSATTFLSTVFDDVWRPPLVALSGVIVLGFLFRLVARRSSNNLLDVMTGEAWHHDGQLPIGGLLVTAAVSAALLYLAQRRLARLDF